VLKMDEKKNKELEEIKKAFSNPEALNQIKKEWGCCANKKNSIR
jgi:hypothetical protein